MSLNDDMIIDPVPQAAVISYRSTRFSGEIQNCQIDEILAESLDGLKWLYKWLQSLGRYRFKSLGRAEHRINIEALLAQDNLDRVTRLCAELKPDAKAPLRVAYVLHDLRGTALQQIVTIASFQPAGALLDAYQTIMILAQDHAKIMRHSVHGLDEPERQKDSAHRLHGIDNLYNRFPSLMFQNKSGAVRTDFSAAWRGDFATSCPEFSTVLKIIYNFIDNATRHTNDGLVLIRAYPKSPPEPNAVRLVVGNSISELDRAVMSERGKTQLWRGLTTTGSGLGLQAVAGLVSEAFGLDTQKRAVDLGYVGSRITASGYLAWFHWPTVPNKVDSEPAARAKPT